MRLDKTSYNWLLLQQEIANTHQRYLDKQVQKGIKDKDPNFVKDPLNGTWEWRGQIYIPTKRELREKVIWNCHDEPTAGHPGITKTLEIITREFQWPQMKHDIELFVQVCHTCQIIKPNRQPQNAPLQPNEIPVEPWAIIV